MPVAFLYLEVPPHEVDVNVHPTKIEVRFRDAQRLYSQLLSTVRHTFLSSDLHSRLQVPEAAPAAPAVPASSPTFRPSAVPPLTLASQSAVRHEVGSWFNAGPSPAFQSFPSPGYAGGRPAPDWARSLPPLAASLAPGDRFDEFGTADNLTGAAPTALLAAPSEQSGRISESALPLAPEPTEPGPLTKAIQVHDSYLIAETDEGMVVIDQHALHERILYEELRQRLQQGGTESQRLLVPVPVDLDAADAAEILQRADVLSRLGIGVEPFGGDTVLVSSLPAMLSGGPPERLLRDLADHLRSKPHPPSSDAVLEDVLNMIACKAAVKAGQKLSPEEISALLERRHLVANTHHCPHGRPTALTFTKTELERQFGRI
jgi:DNA mismatch repair protein MutL